MPQKKGPKVPPLEAFDNFGRYLIYPGKFCKAEGCGVQLTDRNRSGGSLLCRTHASTNGGAYVPPSRVRKDRSLTDIGRELHSLLDGFLCHPTEPERLEILNSKLVNYGLHALFRCL
jgi:hypothetical protein